MSDADSAQTYNYGVFAGGVYETRHEAVGEAAVLNREKPFDVHFVAVMPDVLGVAERLTGIFSNALRTGGDR